MKAGRRKIKMKNLKTPKTKITKKGVFGQIVLIGVPNIRGPVEAPLVSEEGEAEDLSTNEEEGQEKTKSKPIDLKNFKTTTKYLRLEAQLKK